MSVKDEIEEKLHAAFAPTRLEVEDDSESHRGHAGFQEGGESHFNVEIAAPQFGDLSRIERHRAIHAALGLELIGRIHALALKVSG